MLPRGRMKLGVTLSYTVKSWTASFDVERYVSRAMDASCAERTNGKRREEAILKKILFFIYCLL
jgi:hypothetical protein